METTNMNNLKERVGALWDIGRANDALELSAEYLGDDEVQETLAQNQLQSTDNVLFELIERAQEATNDMDLDTEYTDMPREMLDQIDMVKRDKRTALWDVSSGYEYNDLRPATKEDLYDVIDELSND